eukprot:GHRQ01034700.1.p1 GENE.GHRQ01034700.1~~GHRQ01034700.1.p1  ORF type:complete len:162 (-),score=12.61 GHRQ01034700.1:179-664(-)
MAFLTLIDAAAVTEVSLLHLGHGQLCVCTGMCEVSVDTSRGTFPYWCASTGPLTAAHSCFVLNSMLPSQVMFGANKTIAAQDPSYPVYVDTTVMMGNTGAHNGTGFDGIEYMVCTPQNNFFPDLSKVQSPGAASRRQGHITRSGPVCVAQVLLGLSRDNCC